VILEADSAATAAGSGPEPAATPTRFIGRVQRPDNPSSAFLRPFLVSWILHRVKGSRHVAVPRLAIPPMAHGSDHHRLQSYVMPAQAGIQSWKESIRRLFHHWIPASAGMTTIGDRKRRAGTARQSGVPFLGIVDARHARRSGGGCVSAFGRWSVRHPGEGVCRFTV